MINLIASIFVSVRMKKWGLLIIVFTNQHAGVIEKSVLVHNIRTIIYEVKKKKYIFQINGSLK